MNTRLPTIADLLSDPAASHWLKDSLQRALQRDPVDCANEAEVLAAVLSQRADESLASAGIVSLNPP